MFKIEFDKEIFKNDLIYRIDEYSFDYTPYGSTDISLLVDYLQIHIDSLYGKVHGVDGFHSYKIWKPAKLTIPTYKNGHLICTVKYPSGSINRIIQKVETFYDENTGWICIGNMKDSKDTESVRFATDMIATIKDNKLIALWLHPRFE